jgi:hypothetical protein
MKNYCGFLWVFLFLSCGLRDGEAPVRLEFPPVPAAWTELLGEPRWFIRYYAGGEQEAYLEDGGEFFLPPSAAGPVFAWPYWPARRLEPGDFRPAGLILPYDARPPEGASERRLVLSWQGGVDAWFYQALEIAAPEIAVPENTAAGDLEPPRRGRNFNWPKFRDLFSDPSVPQELREDPWRADWEAIAEKTLSSGFRKQWLKATETSALSIPVPPGPWISPSPFTPSLEFGDGPCVFPVGPGPAVRSWYSAWGILHCSEESWMLLPWE